jgi:hypothetical protein
LFVLFLQANELVLSRALICRVKLQGNEMLSDHFSFRYALPSSRIDFVADVCMLDKISVHAKVFDALPRRYSGIDKLTYFRRF